MSKASRRFKDKMKAEGVPKRYRTLKAYREVKRAEAMVRMMMAKYYRDLYSLQKQRCINEQSVKTI